MISIIDYGMGNLRSVEKALQKLGFEARLITEPGELASSEKVILPGVGAFGDAMKGLEQRGLVEPVREYARSGRPLLGICLGMQVFFERSEEDPGIAGLGVLKGDVKRFPASDLKVPHMGWNNLDVQNGSRLLQGLGPEPYVYFVHSYYVSPQESDVVAATTDYGQKFVSVVERQNIFGTQFHPEKSQELGMRILTNFARI